MQQNHEFDRGFHLSEDLHRILIRISERGNPRSKSGFCCSRIIGVVLVNHSSSYLVYKKTPDLPFSAHYLILWENEKSFCTVKYCTAADCRAFLNPRTNNCSLEHESQSGPSDH